MSNIGIPIPASLKTSSLHLAKPKNCPSCGTPFNGRYCYCCGEKKLERDEMTLRYFFSSVWNAITFTDVKFMRTISALLLKPGKLSSEFFAGRRKLYMAPLALFFFINLVYFIYQPVDALNSSLVSQTTGQFYSDWANTLVHHTIEVQKLDSLEFAIAYNQMSSQISKLFLVVFVLFFALGVAAVNMRSKALFYFHLIAATHYVSFAILSLLIICPLLATGALYAYFFMTGGSSIDMDPNAWYVTLPAFIVLGWYAFKMQRRLYRGGVLLSVLKAVLLFVAFALSVVLYRLFLFVCTMAFVQAF